MRLLKYKKEKKGGIKAQKVENLESLANRTVQLEGKNGEFIDLNAWLEDLTSVASHDLQEPLRTHVAFSDLPERGVQD